MTLPTLGNAPVADARDYPDQRDECARKVQFGVSMT